MKTDLITQLLEQGLTAEEIHKRALELEKQISATREKEKKDAEARAAARTALIKAIDNYVESINGSRISPEDATIIENAFIHFEQSLKDQDNTPDYASDFIKLWI